MTIRYDERGIMFKNGKAVKLLYPGRHFIAPLGAVEKYNLFDEITPGFDASILADLPEFTANTECVELYDHNIALHFEDKVFSSVLGPGKHYFWKNAKQRTFITVDLNNPRPDAAVTPTVLANPLVREHVAAYAIEPYETGLLFIDKVFAETLAPGNYYFWKGTKSVNVVKADLRLQQLEIPGQEILTKDKVMLRINFTCQYKITNARQALTDTNDYQNQLYVRLQMLLREYAGSLMLDELLQKKDEINAFVLAGIRKEETAYGLETVSVGIKDIILPGEIKDILNQVLIAEKKAQANIITRREETASTRSLLNTAKLMEDNEVLYKLKELEYIEKISEKISQISLTGGGPILDQLKQLFGQSMRQNKNG